MHKWLIGLLAIPAAVAIAVATVPDAGVTAQRHSCGYHCNPDGSPATPAAPPVVQDSDGDGVVDGTIQQVRANIHSGGRTGGFANHRVGCGGCKDHPASYIGNEAGFQLMGRANIHSGGRAGGRAQPRTGGAPRRSMGWV